MQYIEPGSTSQSLVMYLQDAVTGGPYVTEDQADWTFNYVREGVAAAVADATITAGTLGTWADGTSKPFGTTGLWQIDFADAAFAAGVKYVILLVTHDNGDFLPVSVTVDLSVRQADTVELGGGAQSATDLKDFADSGYDPSTHVAQADITYIHGTALTETAGQLAGAFTKFFNVGSPTATCLSLPDAVPGAAGALVTGDGSVTFTAGVGNRPAVDAEGISGDTTAADNLEAAFDGTGYSHLYQQMSREKYGVSGTVWHIKYAAGEDDSKDGLSWATAKETAGALVKEVIEDDAAVGDAVLIGPGTFALGADRIKSFPGVTVRGAGIDVTTITSTFTGTGAIVNPGSNSLIEDFTIHGLDVGGNTQYPLGSTTSINDVAFTNAVARRIKIVGDADGIYISDSGQCTLTAIDCIIEAMYDGVYCYGHNDHTITLIRPYIRVIGPSNVGSGQYANGISVMQGKVYCVEPTIRAEGGTDENIGIRTGGANANVIVWDPRITTTGTGAASFEQDTGTIIVVGGDYDQTSELGTITRFPDATLDEIQAVTDNLPDSGALTTIAADAARLTAARAAVLTDWTDGGRLDLLLDAVQADVTGLDGDSSNDIADAILSRDVSNVEATEGLDEHSLCGIVLGCMESLVAGTSWTIYRTDGATVFATKTVAVDADADPITGVS